jgi:hypothetical protein
VDEDDVREQVVVGLVKLIEVHARSMGEGRRGAPRHA